TSQKQEVLPNSYKSIANQIGLNFFSAYYKQLAKNLYGFISWNASGNYGFSSYNSNSGGVESIQKTNSINIGISAVPGITYKLNKRLLVNAALNNILAVSFSGSKTTYSNSSQVDKNNRFNLSSSLSGGSLGNIGIGFSYLLK
ncbi:MAG TPA: hypothetical protein VHP12_01295, partial [Chitinophagaceae bacterium]|nr:hypothetical protein [Chitinophagaceae bacterium]